MLLPSAPRSPLDHKRSFGKSVDRGHRRIPADLIALPAKEISRRDRSRARGQQDQRRLGIGQLPIANEKARTKLIRKKPKKSSVREKKHASKIFYWFTVNDFCCSRNSSRVRPVIRVRR